MPPTKTEVLLEATEKGFAQVTNAVTNLTTALGNIGKKSPPGITKLAKEMDVLRGSINTLVTTVDKLATTFDKGGAAGSRFGDRLTMGAGGAIKSLITDTEMMIKVQMRWYLARAVLFAAVQAPIAAVREIGTYIIEVDRARSEMLRWGATSGEVTDQMRKGIELVLTQVRRATTEFPVTFAELSKTTQAFIGAGIGESVVARMVPDIARMQTAFKEINFEQFAVALTGTFNVFKESMKGAADEADAFAAIVDKLMKAQATGIIRPEQFTTVMQYMSQVGKLAGFTLDQILAMSVAITDTGIKAQSASRLMASLMLSLSSPERLQMLKNIGITLDRTLPMAAQFDELLTKFGEKIGRGGAIPLGWMGVIQEIAGKEQAKILVTMIERLKEYKDLLKAIEESKGGLIAAADIMTMPISSQWVIFLSILKEIGTGVGSGAAVALKEIMATLVDMANGALVAANRTGIFADKLDKLGSAGKTTRDVFNSLITIIDQLKSLFGVFGTILAPITKLFGGLGVAIELLTTFYIGKLLIGFKSLSVSAGLLSSAFITGGLKISGWGIKLAGAGTALAILGRGILSFLTGPLVLLTVGIVGLTELFRYLNAEMDKTEKRDLGFANMLQAAKSSQLAKEKSDRAARLTQIDEEIAKNKQLVATADTIFKGVGTEVGRAQEALKKLRSERDQLRREISAITGREKTLLGEKGPPKKVVPGEPVPPEDIKGYESRIRDVMMKMLKAENQIAEYKRQQALANLELEHKVLGLADAEYNARKVAIAKQATDEQMGNLEAAWPKIEALYTKEMEHARLSDEKKLALTAARTFAEVEFEKLKEKITTDVVKAGAAEQIANYEDYRKAVERIQKSIYDITISNIDEIADAEKASFTIRQAAIEDLYSRGIISAGEYFDRLKAIAIEGTESRIKAETAKLQAYFDQMSNISSLLSEIGVELPADVKEAFGAESTAKMNAYADAVKKIRTDLMLLFADLELIKDRTPEIVFDEKGLGGAFGEFLTLAIKDFGNMGLHLKAIANEIAKGLSQSFSDFFFDIWTGKLKSLSDYWMAFSNSILRVWANVVSEMIVQWLLKKVIAIATAETIIAGITAEIVAVGALTAAYWSLALAKMAAGVAGVGVGAAGAGAGVVAVAHTGGIMGRDTMQIRYVPSSAFAGAPRFHQGFAPDEYPAILKRDEGVFTSGQMKALGNFLGNERKQLPIIVNMNVYANDADSFNSRIMQSKEMVAAAMMSVIGNNHPVRRSR